MKKKPMKNTKTAKHGNAANLIVRHGQEAAELGRRGGLASGAARRARCSFAEALRHALTVPIPVTSDRAAEWEREIERFGLCDCNAQNLIVARMIQEAINGDVRAAAFIRDTLTMTSGGIDADSDTPNAAKPVTADGRARLMRYHYLELADVHDDAKEKMRLAKVRDSPYFSYDNVQHVQDEIALDVSMQAEAGNLRLTPDMDGVTYDRDGAARWRTEVDREIEATEAEIAAEGDGE